MKQIKTKHFANILSLFFIGLLIYGCALSKEPEHETIVSDALPETTIPETWIATSDTLEVVSEWLKSFNDPALETIVEEALQNNLNLQNAATAVQIAQQNVIIVGSQMKPQIGLNMGYQSIIDDGSKEVFGSGKALGIISWEPDVWGKIRAQKSSIGAYYEATELDYNYAKQSLVALTARSWYQAVQANQLYKLSNEVVTSYTELHELVKIRRDLGKVGDIDVAEANANLSEAKSDLIKAEGIVLETKRNLEVLVGRYPSSEIETAQNFTPVPPPIKPGIPSTLLERRPDILAAEKLVLSSFRNQEVAKLNMLPSFSLNLGGGLLSDNILSLLQLNPLVFAGGIGMSVPIYTGGRLKAQLQIATIEQQQAVLNYGIVMLNAFKEVETYLVSEDLIAKRIPFQQAILDDRNETVKFAELKYEMGQIDLLSVIQIKNKAIATKEELIKLLNEQLSNRISLHLALGGDFQ
ncbi:TolC family protein [Bizionia arctica]|uniref:Multidrug transporter n=1 Tax=Bizionia arctica TaxID=1495645 RepID=A0A917LLY4_9FLAO|nr:TolC family protein [Bizionia arctica]GGG43220.1 multidrug transporter [Bizionia arctica]